MGTALGFELHPWPHIATALAPLTRMSMARTFLCDSRRVRCGCRLRTWCVEFVEGTADDPDLHDGIVVPGRAAVALCEPPLLIGPDAPAAVQLLLSLGFTRALALCPAAEDIALVGRACGVDVAVTRARALSPFAVALFLVHHAVESGLPAWYRMPPDRRIPSVCEELDRIDRIVSVTGAKAFTDAAPHHVRLAARWFWRRPEAALPALRVVARRAARPPCKSSPAG